MKIIKKNTKPVKLLWTPSSQLIQGVMNTFHISKPQAVDQMNKMAEVATRMNLNFNQLSDNKILQIMIAVQGKLGANKPNVINNTQGKK